MITDCHIHIQPPEMFRTEVRLKMAATPQEFARIAELAASPATLLRHLDDIAVERAVLIGCVAPEVMGTGPEINPWLANYSKADPQRLLMCGSVNPRHSLEVQRDMEDVLRTVARILSEGCRAIDMVARYGGEEFAIVLPETDIEAARGLCERLRNAVAQYDWQTIRPTLAVTMSFGIASNFPKDTEPAMDYDKLLDAADAQLYGAKWAGRNRVSG